MNWIDLVYRSSILINSLAESFDHRPYADSRKGGKKYTKTGLDCVRQQSEYTHNEKKRLTRKVIDEHPAVGRFNYERKQMTNTTETMIRQLCSLDTSIDPVSVDDAIDVLRKRTDSPIDTPITLGEAAQMLKVTTATIRRYVKRGVLRAIGNRRWGIKVQTKISRQSVIDFINGKTR